MATKHPNKQGTPSPKSGVSLPNQQAVKESIRRLERAAERIQEARRVIKSK